MTLSSAPVICRASGGEFFRICTNAKAGEDPETGEELYRSGACCSNSHCKERPSRPRSPPPCSLATSPETHLARVYEASPMKRTEKPLTLFPLLASGVMYRRNVSGGIRDTLPESLTFPVALRVRKNFNNCFQLLVCPVLSFKWLLVLFVQPNAF